MPLSPNFVSALGLLRDAACAADQSDAEQNIRKATEIFRLMPKATPYEEWEQAVAESLLYAQEENWNYRHR